MKKALSIAIALILCLVLFTACGEKATTTDETETDKPLRVCLMCGLLGDKSFSDSAKLGADQAVADFGVDLTVVQLDYNDDFEQAVQTACAEGYDVIVAGMSQYQEYIERACVDYPDIMFGITDTVATGDNIMSVTFAQNQGSFLCGYAAARFTEMTTIPGVNEEKIIGWVGGNEIPALRDFFIGFTEGAKYYNPDITILQSYAGDFNNPLKGKELTLAMYDQGADIVMNVASATGNGVLEAAKESGHYAIGVDMNQDNDQPGAVLTSMLKENGQGVYSVIEAAVNGTFQGDTSMYMDLAHKGVDTTDMSTIKSYLSEDNQKLIDELLAEISDLKDKIASGEIVVSNYEGYGPNA